MLPLCIWNEKKMLASSNKASFWFHGTCGKEDFCNMVPYYQGTPTVRSYVPVGLVEPLSSGAHDTLSQFIVSCDWCPLLWYGQLANQQLYLFTYLFIVYMHSIVLLSAHRLDKRVRSSTHKPYCTLCSFNFLHWSKILLTGWQLWTITR